jgi:hypothetical protein
MPQESTSTALALPDDIREELLRAQRASVSTPQDLPQIRVMNGGVGLFEFKDTNETEREFQGVILGAHDANILWERDINTPAPSDEEKRPACSSNNGVVGIPRKGFRHEALGGGFAEGTEQIACQSCPYNKFGSGAKLIAGKNPKGKAVTNQKMVYVLIPGRAAPMELVLNAMSIKQYDEYAGKLGNQGIPTQAIVTTFSQKIVNKTPTLKYGVVEMRNAGALDMATLEKAVATRRRFISNIEPAVEVLMEGTMDDEAAAAASEPVSVTDPSTGALASSDEELPF